MGSYCETCEVNPPDVKGECDTCYRYRKRTGRTRPVNLTERQGDLNARDREKEEERALKRLSRMVSAPLGAVSTNTETSVYRFYDKAKNLLYVGITGRGAMRFQEHASDKPWWGQVYSVRVEHYPTRREAILREAYLIATFSPRFNIADPWRRLKTLARSQNREILDDSA